MTATLAYLRPLEAEAPHLEELPLKTVVNVACLNGRVFTEVVGQVIGRTHNQHAGMTYEVQGNGVTLHDVTRDRIVIVRLPQ